MARTFLQMVQAVVSSLGETPPSTVAAPNPTTKVAMGAVNDALQDIYSRARWQFRVKRTFLTLYDGLPGYLLPDDFGELRLPYLASRNAQEHIVYVSVADLEGQHADWVALIVPETTPAAWGQGAVQYGFDNKGTPKQFTIWNDTTLILWPAPDAAFIANQQLSGGGGALAVPYYANAPELASDSQVIPLPPDMMAAAQLLSQARAKQYLEFADYVADERRAERLLKTLVNRKTRRVNVPLRFRVRSY